MLEVLRNARALLVSLVLVGCGSDDPEEPVENGGKTQVDAASSVPDAGSAPDDAAVDVDGAVEAAPQDASRPDAAPADAATDAAIAAAADAASADAAGADAAVDASAPVVDAGPPVKYANVAPIFAAYCVSCHAPGSEGPFSLDNYDDASDYGAEAYAAASARIMPPCAANDPSCGPTLAQLATLRSWVLQGTPP